MNFESIIFNNLLFNEQYSRKTIPFLKSEYFSDHNDKVIFNLIDSYIKQYNRIPTKETLLIDLSNKSGLSESVFKDSKTVIENISDNEKSDLQWLLDKTEKWCQEKALHNAIYESIQILDDKTGKKQKGAIPELLSDALAVSFDSHIGHDFLEDAESRFDFYHTKEVRDRKSTRLNSSHVRTSRMPSSA